MPLFEIAHLMLPSEFLTYFKITKVGYSSERVCIRLALKILGTTVSTGLCMIIFYTLFKKDQFVKFSTLTTVPYSVIKVLGHPVLCVGDAISIGRNHRKKAGKDNQQKQ